MVTFRGHVRAAQADALLTSDTLTVSYGKDFHEVKEMVADNNVRMSQGTRWATGDHAVLDQAKHTVTLTGSPVVHDGEDQVTGSKITVHLTPARAKSREHERCSSLRSRKPAIIRPRLSLSRLSRRRWIWHPNSN